MAQENPTPSTTEEVPRAGEQATHGAGGMLGAVAGAAAGAALGALAGPLGLAAGAVAGAVLGGVAGGSTVERLDRNAARYVAGNGSERPDNDGGDRPLAGKNTDRPR